MDTRENAADVAAKVLRVYTPDLSGEEIELVDRYREARMKELGLLTLSRGNAIWMAARDVMLRTIGGQQS